MHCGLDEAVEACMRLGRKGTGHFAPTLLTAEPGLLREACRRWGSILEKSSRRRYLPKHAAIPLGLHLEGPFLNPKMAGAHPKAALAAPSWGLAAELISLARSRVAIVTVAPELPGALQLIRKLSKTGVRVQLGHTLATSGEALAAAAAGATGITHLFNAMKVHHREPGVLAPLARGLLTAEIITDGVHLDPQFVHWCTCAARGKLYAVSDGCSAVGARKGARLTLGSLKLRREGPAALTSPGGVLAGGATFLSEHPSLLAKQLGATEARKLLPLFHELQSRLFRSGVASGRNHFDRRTLRFVGRD
jgi:N-acetylglucosamine-6-phosphate deacetylase